MYSFELIKLLLFFFLDFQLTQLNQAGNSRFDELEVIQLIPVIIEQLKEGHVSGSEQAALEKIFGDLWPMLVAEAKRVEGEEMNSVLKALLQSEEVRFAKRDISKQIGNDIYKNSVRRVYRGDNDNVEKPYISLDDDRKMLSPSQRLLNMVAAIVYKANLMAKSSAKLRHEQRRKNLRRKNKKQKNPLGIVTVEKRRQRFADRLLGINRMKRSLIKFSSDLVDMKSLLEKVNHANSFEKNEDENEEIDDQDDYMNDDYYEYDDDYQMSPANDYPNPLKWNSQGNYNDDYENGSVNEFIQLAKQRDRREQTETHENLDSSYEDDYEN